MRRCFRLAALNELGWKPAETFTSGIAKTVRWYLDNAAWVQQVTSGEYRKWIYAIHTNYATTSKNPTFITDDFAISNVGKNLGLNILPIMTKGIKDVGK